jgi:hypothetical protein
MSTPTKRGSLEESQREWRNHADETDDGTEGLTSCSQTALHYRTRADALTPLIAREREKDERLLALHDSIPCLTDLHCTAEDECCGCAARSGLAAILGEKG